MALGVLFSALCLVTSAVAATQSSFDPKDVVRRMQKVHADTPKSGSDDGEFLIDTSITYYLAQGNQGAPSVAFDGANFLVVWEDQRSETDYDIYAARVTPMGQVLDASGIVVSTASDFHWSHDPAVAFDGTDFLVVWDDCRNGAYPGAIYGTRVNQAGTVLDSSGIPISTAAGGQGLPAVSFDGVNFLVVWDDGRNGSVDVYGTRVNQAGTVLDSSGIPISTAAGWQGYPAVSFDGVNFLVVWNDMRSGDTSDIYGARVTQAGTVLDSSGIPISTAAGEQASPTVSFDGASFLVVWEDKRSGAYADIYGARVTPGGVVLDPTGIAVSSGAGYQWQPAVAFDGTNSLVVWTDERNGPGYDLYGARVTPQGTVLDPTGFVVSAVAPSSQLSSAAAFDGGNFLVVWEDWRGHIYSDIYGARVTPGCTVLDSTGIAVSTATNDQESPAAAFDGTNFLVVWEDQRSGSWDVYGARVTPQGIVLDPQGFVISQGAYDQLWPVLGFDGANFLVVWEDQRSGSDCDIYAARVTPQGTVLDPQGFVISQGAYDQLWPALGFDGTNFLVAWEDERSGWDYDIYAARVTPAGQVLDANGVAVSTAPNDQRSPAVGFDGANFLVVWNDVRSGDTSDIYGARVSQAGVVLDPDGIAISTVTNYQESPAVSFDGTNWLVVWTDGRSGGYSDVYGARVSRAGVVLDPDDIAISTAANYQESPAVSFDGTNWLVIWTDGRSGGYSDIYGARVTISGTVLDEFPVITQEENQYSPALVRGAGSQMFLAYQGWAATVSGKTYNTDRIWGKMDPNPGIEETMNDERGTLNVGPSIVRGVLVLGAAGSRQITAHGAQLLNAVGRKVLDLKPGANDVHSLAPGVYFVREEPRAASLKFQAVRKVVVTR